MVNAKIFIFIREAILLLPFVNNGGRGSGASFVNNKNLSLNAIKLPKKVFLDNVIPDRTPEPQWFFVVRGGG